MRSFYLTDVGKVRDHNEDSVIILKNHNNDYMLAVADGMGGHRAGEVASSIAITYLGKHFQETFYNLNKEQAILWINDSIDAINKQIFKHEEVDNLSVGMGTTLVIALYTSDYLLFGNIGDSSGFVLKNNHLHKMMDTMEAEYMKEAFFGDKYPPIDPSTFDYIDIKTAGIKSLDDKMMLSVYIQSKIDMLNSYLKVLTSGNSSKAKKIPYTEDDILVLKDRLLQQKENVLNARIPGRNNGMLIAWPEGYEG